MIVKLTFQIIKMKKSLFLKRCLLHCIIMFAALNMFAQTSQAGEEYVCTPCGSDCDNTTYKEPGTCRHCQMQLVPKATVHFKSIQPSAVCAYVAAHPDVVLLDVRTRAEFAGEANPDYGHLKNAINIPIQELESRLSELEKFKGKEIIVYCSHSRRSPRASYLLTQHGYSNVTNMVGGMSVWKSTVKDKSCVE